MKITLEHACPCLALFPAGTLAAALDVIPSSGVTDLLTWTLF